MIKDFKKRFFVSLFLTVPVLILSPLIQGFLGFDLGFKGDKYLLLVLSGLVFGYGGAPFLKGAVEEIKERRPGMMALIGTAISVSFVYSSLVALGLSGRFFFWELVTLIDVMLLGHWIEMRSVKGASRALEELARLLPSQAHLIGAGGEIKEVPVSDLRSGDVVLVKPGEKIPADGMVVEGETSVDESMLTGESVPVFKQEKEGVIGGSLNKTRAVNVEITRTGKDSYLSRIIELVEKAQASKSRVQGVADRVAFYLTLTALFTGTATFLVWWVVRGDVLFSLERMVTVMVITCPHALGLAVPLVIAVSTSISARNGVLIRKRIPFEKARELDIVVFDKTGTLTEGRFGVGEVVGFGEYGGREVLEIAASLESRSGHPIAKSIMEKAEEEGVSFLEVKEVQIIPGRGVEGVVKGKGVKVVSPSYLKEKGVLIKERKELAGRGKTVVYVLVEEELAGALVLRDKIKKESKRAVNKLKAMGKEVAMLTGDREEVAVWVKEEIGLSLYFSEVLPHEKREVIRKLKQKGKKVAMVGDGVNDAPSLAEADLGVAIGAGADVAVESADVVLVRNNPEDVVSLIRLSELSHKKMKQNLAWAVGYNLFAIPLAAGVFYDYGILLSPAVGAVLMSLSTVIVAFNARFMRFS